MGEVVTSLPHIQITWYRACVTPKLAWSNSIQYSQKDNTSYCMYLKNYKTNRNENSGQYWDHENVIFDSIVWRHSKFKMMDGRHCNNRYIAISQRKIIRFWLKKIGAHKQIMNRTTATWPKLRIFKFNMADGRHIEHQFFGHNSAADCSISFKFFIGNQTSRVGTKILLLYLLF